MMMIMMMKLMKRMLTNLTYQMKVIAISTKIIAAMYELEFNPRIDLQEKRNPFLQQIAVINGRYLLMRKNHLLRIQNRTVMTTSLIVLLLGEHHSFPRRILVGQHFLQ